MAHLQDRGTLSKIDISPLTGTDLFVDVPIPETDVEEELTKVWSEYEKKDEEIQALREEMDLGRTEPETAEHSDTSQRDLAEAPDEIDAMRKKIQDLTSEVVGLNNQLDSLRSSDSALHHQGGEAGSQLASKREEVQQLHEKLWGLRDKHNLSMRDENHKRKASRRSLQLKN